jgi:hypothetical protein
VFAAQVLHRNSNVHAPLKADDLLLRKSPFYGSASPTFPRT